MNTLTDSSLTQSMLDPDTRRDIRNDPRQYAIDNEIIAADSEIEVKLVINGPDTMYVPLAQVEHLSTISSEELLSIQAAGNTNGSVGTATTASSISTLTSTVGSAGSASTAGTAGSA